MYLQHFGLRESPFSITPDTDFFYAYPRHQEALDVLRVALADGEGFIKITGEVGTGKTLLCRKLLGSLPVDVLSAWLPNPQMDAAGLRAAVAEELGIDTRRLGANELHKRLAERLIEHHEKGRQVLLVIDEAQALGEAGLEAVRLLTNLETEKSKLLQVVLFGQPELDTILARPSIRQLRQRITFSYRITPLDAPSVADYLSHRMRRAGYDGQLVFDPRAARMIARGSRGVPRLVNILAHKALMSAYGTGERRIARDHVRRAIHDTAAARQSAARVWWPW
jgi:MSHA biogenesis protein MshM